MSDRSHRGSTQSVRARRVDQLMLPAVVLLLLVGAGFVVLAWSEASDVVTFARQADDRRVEYLADSVDQVLQRRVLDLEEWGARNGALARLGREQALQQELARRVTSGPSGSLVAYMVVRSDGSVAGVGEPVPGRIS